MAAITATEAKQATQGYKIINASDFDPAKHTIFDPDKKYNEPVKLSKTQRKKAAMLEMLEGAGVYGYTKDNTVKELQQAIDKIGEE